MRNFHFPGRSPVLASNGMVATSHPLAASEALTLMKQGGNAVDAAIAGAILLGVCEPHMTGIGGDCFALIKPAGTDEVTTINGSGRAPAGLDPDVLRREGITKIEPGHPASITVPGAVDALCRLSERFGRIGLDRCLAPAIRYFEDGVPISPRTASDIVPGGPGMTDAARAHFLNSGRPYRLGERMRLPGQAEVLRRIAANGRNAFYEGEVLDDMLSALAGVGGTHAAEDFTATEADWSTPVSGRHGDFDVLEHRPNGQGATALLLLNTLSHFDLSSMDPIGFERIHIEAEASKFAYDARNRFLADPDRVTRLEHMLAPETAERLAALIDLKKATAAPAALTEDVHKDTVLIVAVDRDGMAVSLIYSLFSAFGSGVASPKFGILFQNRGSGFNLIPGHPNEAGPSKRPLHTIIPAMRKADGKVDMAFGVMGGQYQATGHAHFLTNVANYGMDLQEAMDGPRSFADPTEGTLQVEDGIPDATRERLAKAGHRLSRPDVPIGGAQAILIDHESGTLTGASDPRKDGAAVGF